MRLVLVVLALLAAPASAQGLQIHAAVTSDAPGDTGGMRRQSVATALDREVWVGPVVLDLPAEAIQTVGLELDVGGGTALSLWLSDDASAAFAALTGRSVGQALAVVYDGRVLTAPVVRSAIPNGLVMITGLGADEAGRLADALRAATAPGPAAAPAVSATPPPVRRRLPQASVPDVPVRPAMRLDPPPTDPADGPAPSPSAPAPPATAPVVSAPSSSGSPGRSASATAQAFTGAVSRRDWRAVARALHPDALRAVQPWAVEMLRLDGPTVTVRDQDQRASFDAASALGARPSAGSISELGDLDRAVLYLAGLDALGVWGEPGPSRAVVGEVLDGDRLHVVLRDAAPSPGVSEVTVVTLARDGRGDWRPVLTQPQGF